MSTKYIYIYVAGGYNMSNNSQIAIQNPNEYALVKKVHTQQDIIDAIINDNQIMFKEHIDNKNDFKDRVTEGITDCDSTITQNQIQNSLQQFFAKQN